MAECCICCTEFSTTDDTVTDDTVTDDTVTQLPCHSTHKFHTKCIEQWDIKNKGCPVCRCKPPEPVDDNDGKGWFIYKYKLPKMIQLNDGTTTRKVYLFQSTLSVRVVFTENYYMTLDGERVHVFDHERLVQMLGQFNTTQEEQEIIEDSKSGRWRIRSYLLPGLLRLILYGMQE